MKTNTQTKSMLATLLLALGAYVQTVAAANVTTYDNVVSLATNVTKNYTFTDTASGQSVVVAVTMKAYSSSNASPVFTTLDDYGSGPTHLGVDSGLGGGDGNWVDSFEGLNFTASLVAASSGVPASSIRFGITGIGLRDGGGTSTQRWASPAGTNMFTCSGETFFSLDAGTAALAGSTYAGQLRFTNSDEQQYQVSDTPAGQSIGFNVTFTVANQTDPRTNSWLTTYAGKYARIYTSDVNKTNGTAVTTWSTGGTTQANPVYCGVQEIYSSSNWVYIRSTGLGSHIMGPWYLNAAHTQAFPNYPTNEHVLYRIPRNPTNAAVKTRNGGGAIGYFVDGVAMFNSWDAYSYTNGADTQGGGNGGYWNRDAYVNEGVSFDNNNAHQAGGQHHYHANPPALRYLLGDHVDFNTVTKAYPEDTNTPTKHSPILGWVSDGYPIYGPYGYSVSNNAASGIRRMVSGYVPRNGQYGNQNLTAAGRTYLPQWAVRLFNCASNVYAGPAVSTSYPLGRYMEDNDYLGDLGVAMGTNTFDLDEYNGRWCVTPEFPNGTYAYFVSISANGAPVFPYNIGRGYYGNPTGGAVASIAESVVTNLLTGPAAAPALNSPTAKSGAVTLTWSATEGGTYMVQSTTNFSAWTTNSTTVTSVLNAAAYTNNPTDKYRFYRVAQTALATYDSPGTGGYTPTISTVAPGGTAARGTTVTVTITLPSSPPNPPAGAPITSVTLAGSIAGTSISDNTAGQVIATFTIPSGASTGAQSISVVFTSGPTYTVSSLTIN